MEGGYDPVGVGPFAVSVRTLHLRDRVRGRRLPCELWYPADPHTTAAVDPGQEVRGAAAVRDRMPLVLFSPLAGGDRRSSTFLCRHLAGHGYAVAAVDHSEVVVPELAARPGESASARQARVAAVIASRVPDLRFVLAGLLDERPEQAGEVELDPMRVGVVGHSFGGWTALATPEQEPRVRAVVAEDLTWDKSDPKDAVLIARLAAQLRCYEPERADASWARLRQLGARRARLVTEATAGVQQLRDLLDCVWPVVLDAAGSPFRRSFRAVRLGWHRADRVR